MLTELNISNFAIIENQAVPFERGLNVITGETGSGKSIILNALELILGGRSSITYIRSGAESLEVQAHFDLSELPEEVFNSLPDIARAEELVVSRSLNQSGKGKVYINGNLGTVSLLGEIGSRLISICGQSNHIRLLDPAYHIELLDGFAKNGTLLEDYRRAFATWRDLVGRLSDLEQSSARAVERRGELEALIEEIRPLEITKGIRVELEARVRRLGNSQRLVSGIHDLLSVFSDPEGISLHISAIGSKLAELEKLAPDLRSLGESFASVRSELGDLERALGRALASVECDEESLGVLSDKLAEIARVERKYRCSDEGLLNLLTESEAELLRIGSADGLESLRRESAALEKEARRLADSLTRERHKACGKLSKVVEGELRELNMAGAALHLELRSGELGPTGSDRVEFLISTNKGEAAKPLKQIASGGELSRIMLVLKKVLRERSGVNVLVFDEVDTGISGAVARAVGQKLQSLAEQSQVICITHLAQVASFADHHLLVDKRSGKRTVSEIRCLKGEEKVDEIARMLAGYTITPASRQSARELLSSK